MAENIRHLPIWPTITLAWQKTKGVKKTIWAAIGTMLLILLLLVFVFTSLEIMFLDLKASSTQFLEFIFKSILQLITFLFQAGLLIIGIRRAADNPVNFRMIFSAFNITTAIKLIGYYILQFLIVILAFVPVIVISILLDKLTSDISKDFFSGVLLAATIFGVLYLLIRIYLAPGFILDKKANSWQAIRMSFISTRFNFIRLLIVTIIEVFFLVISAIPLGIGLIWSIPFTLICYGVIYQFLSPNAYSESTYLKKD